ncbi:DNA primase [Pelagibius sp. Alg239-R121]|uniref:DNA primase n=1 Tax=Pelagibius sp. Alg239-R121 TaxID=2993448 RepID=UPI0024A6255D|nr:DNA primase [Pelagibius sp. Alg239-R121]
MTIPQYILDDIRNRVNLAGYIGRYVKLAKRGHEHSGLCPFHNEKTPSFTVSEPKGFYHCFGCGAHGDIIAFAMNHQKLAFPEAVEQLAQEAGVEIPKPTPEDQQREDTNARLVAANATAARWFTSQLESDSGKAARDYLAKRGITSETTQRFGLGYAPTDRDQLTNYLQQEGFTQEELIASGLCGEADAGEPALYDRFRDRLMFPIRDRRGRPSAFGGRALGEAKAKYLNSSETPIFKKGATLYNLDQAQKTGRQHEEVIAVEGYMDVIALTQAGFDQVVAPLGTALTETQIAMLWQIAPEPILCFDGDTAGRRAATRAVQRALPGLYAGHSLKIATLPPDHDPDSLVQSQGNEALRSLIESAQPLTDWLWQALVEPSDYSTPERAADFRRAVNDQIQEIRDPGVRSLYQRDYNGRLAKIFEMQFPSRSGPTSNRPRRNGKHGKKPTVGPSPQGPVSSAAPTLERLVLLVLVNHPALLTTCHEALAAITFPGKEAKELQSALLETASAEEAMQSETLANEVERRGLASFVERLKSDRLLKVHSFAEEAKETEIAGHGIQHLFDRLRTLRSLSDDLEEAKQLLASHPTDENWRRFRALTEELRRVSALPAG